MKAMDTVLFIGLLNVIMNQNTWKKSMVEKNVRFESSRPYTFFSV